jgi:hypothetical protein
MVFAGVESASFRVGLRQSGLKPCPTSMLSSRLFEFAMRDKRGVLRFAQDDTALCGAEGLNAAAPR